MKIEKLLATQILDLVGGKENIKAFEHCATRLRLILKDNQIAQANKEKIDKLEKVSGSYYKAGQYQIILGTGFVNKVHNEFEKLVGVSQANVKDEVYSNMNIIQKIARIFGDVFVPIIPALVATGLFMGFRGALLAVNPDIAVNYPNIITLSQVLTDTVFIFLPALVAMYAAKRFGGNQTIGLVAGLMMVAPALPNAWDVSSGAVEPLYISLGALSIPIVGYQGSVLPALVIGIMCAQLEKFFRRFIPDFLDLIVTPFLTLLITLLLGLFLVGPIMHGVENEVVLFFTKLMTLPLGIGGFICGFAMQIIVVTGLHHAFNALEASLLAETGYNAWNAMISPGIAAQGAAAIAVALKARDKKQKTMMISAASSAFFGITEPSIFGVNLERLKPFLYGCVGGGVGGALASILGLKASGMAITVIPGTLLYLGEPQQLIGYLLVHIIACGVAFGLVYFLWDEKQFAKEYDENSNR